MVDDQALFNHARDESRRCYGRLRELLRARIPSPRQASVRNAEILALSAWFEVHGSTLLRLSRWQPENQHFRQAMLDWELRRFGLEFLGLRTSIE